MGRVSFTSALCTQLCDTSCGLRTGGSKAWCALACGSSRTSAAIRCSAPLSTAMRPGARAHQPRTHDGWKSTEDEHLDAQAFSKSQAVNDAVGLVVHSCLLVPYYSWCASACHDWLTLGGCHLQQLNCGMP